MANINDRKTVEREYTQEDHKQYLKTIDDDPDQTFMRVIISIREKAAKDGNFRITHGWQRTDTENDLTEQDLETYVDWDSPSYNDTIDEVIDLARTGVM